mgnify:CR=1 FL=1
MNAPQPPQSAPASESPPAGQAPAAPLPPKRKAVDQAFLPAALEVIETPPSPIRLAILVTICALFAAALIWAFFGRVDVVAVAPGRIQPTGRVKAIEASETGRVATIAVRNGSHVEAGSLLIALDPREAAADVAQLTTELAAMQAEATRRRAAIAAAALPEPVAPALTFDATVPAPVRARESRVLGSDIAALTATLAAIEAQSTEKDAERARLETTIAAQQALIATQGVRVGMRSELVERSAGSKAQLIDAQETQQLQQVTLAEQTGQLNEAKAALDRLAKERRRIVEGFIADNGQKLADAEGRIDEARDKLVKAEARLEQMSIRAPIAGTVTALSIGGSGQVVTTGQEVMRIVPDGSTLELEAYVSNTDIGFIHPGQSVAIKIDAFPFTRYGMLDGRVADVALDAVPRADLNERLASPAAAPRQTGAGGAQAVQDLVFPVIVSITDPSITVDGTTVPLSAGMSAVAEVKTGRRRILEYLFSPLVEVGSEAMKER